MKLAIEFPATIEGIRTALLSIEEQRAQEPWSEGKWTRKQILGHLIDSACNNHQRFVRAALDGSYAGPDYAQQNWVDIHGYADMPWSELVHWWTVQNAILEHVIARIPDKSRDVECRVQNDPPMPLHAIIEDYVRHLQHHIWQITGS